MAKVAQPPAGRQVLPRGPYLGVVASLSGAALGWLAIQPLSDLGPFVTSYPVLDVVGLGLLGGSIGGFLLGFTAIRKGQRALVEAAGGVAVGTLAAVVGGVVGRMVAGLEFLGTSRQGYLVARLIIWGLTSGLLGGALAARFVAIDRSRPADGFGFGLFGGVVAGLIFSLPGPTRIWQLIGFLLVGLSVGFGASRIRRALGVIGADSGPGRAGRLLGHREWEVFVGTPVDLDGIATVEASNGRLIARLVPGSTGSLTVSGRSVTSSAEVGEHEPIGVGNRVYRFSRLPNWPG
jgi:hypothetical protein